MFSLNFPPHRGIHPPRLRNTKIIIRWRDAAKNMSSVKLIVPEDNDVVINTVTKKRSPALGHVSRSHSIGLDWIFDVMERDNIEIKYVKTKFQIADMMTKGFTRKETWNSLCNLGAIGPATTQPSKVSQQNKGTPTGKISDRTRVISTTQYAYASRHDTVAFGPSVSRAGHC